MTKANKKVKNPRPYYEALEDAVIATKKDPKEFDLAAVAKLETLGDTSFYKNPNKAMEVYRGLLQIDPNHLEYNLRMGKLLAYDLEFDSAEAHLLKAYLHDEDKMNHELVYMANNMDKRPDNTPSKALYNQTLAQFFLSKATYFKKIKQKIKYWDLSLRADNQEIKTIDADSYNIWMNDESKESDKIGPFRERWKLE